MTVTGLRAWFSAVALAACCVQPAFALYLLPEPTPEQIEGAISDGYRNCMAETGGYPDIMQACQAAEIDALMVRLHDAIAEICRRKAEPLSGIGADDAAVLGSCQLRHLAKQIIVLEAGKE